MNSVFYYPTTVYQDLSPFSAVAITVEKFPIGGVEDSQVLILPTDEGVYVQGVYVWTGVRWQYALPYPEFCNSIIRGYDISFYHALSADVTTLPSDAKVFRNGQPWSGTPTKGPNVVWTALTGGKSGGGPGGGVQRVNGQAPDGSGNVVVKALPNVGAGTSLVADSGATTGNLVIRNIVSGDNTTITTDGDGNLVISTAAGTGAVASINGKTGAVTLTAADVGAVEINGIINNGVIG